MTFAQQLGVALAAALGPVDPTIHTAIPPRHLGGLPDVLVFRHAPSIQGVVHVSAGMAEEGLAELVLVTPEPASWAPTLLARLAAAQRQRRFVPNGTTPLAGPEAPFAGLLFASAPGLPAIWVGEAYAPFVLAVGITAVELAACRSHGTPAVIELLAQARLFPQSVRRRADVSGLAELGPSPLDRPGLSEPARRGLSAVVYGHAESVEMLRARFSPGDLEILTSTYPALVAFEQRAELVKLTQDSTGACLAPMWRAFARDALAHELEATDSAPMALAIALSSLGGGGSFDTYWDDLDGALAAARAYA